MAEWRPGRRSLDPHAARKLADTTNSVPQMQAITPRWLLRVLPWVNVVGGTYRVNRRLQAQPSAGRLNFTATGSAFMVTPATLSEVPVLQGLLDVELLDTLAQRFVEREYKAGDVLVESGKPADQIMLVVHGKLQKRVGAKSGVPVLADVLGDGDFFGEESLLENAGELAYSVEAITNTKVLLLSRVMFVELYEQFPQLRTHVEAFDSKSTRPVNKHGEAAIEMSAGHSGEPTLPETFVDYDPLPREYELSVTQTILAVHTRVADLYSHSVDQVKEQVRLTIEAIRERQEYELLNNPQFGLLHHAAASQRLPTRAGPPTPEDLDNLISRRRKPSFLLAHPRTIAAFGRECNRRGLYPMTGEVDGKRVHAWRGIPLLPCDKIPIDRNTSSIFVLRTGEEDEGVVGLHLTGIPDEVEPSLSVRFMGIDEHAIMTYLVSAYYSAAILVPDALGILENVEIGR